MQFDRLPGGGVELVAVRPLDLTQEGQELAVTVPEPQRRGDMTGGDLKDDEQGRGAMSVIIV